MRRALAALVLAWPMAAAAQAPRWTADLVGIYDGQIFAGKALVTVITRFSVDVAGGISGTYSYREDDGPEETGHLVNCLAPTPKRLGCEWRDRHGAGTALFTFDDDVVSFQGFWFTPKIRKQGMPWTGKKRVEG